MFKTEEVLISILLILLCASSNQAQTNLSLQLQRDTLLARQYLKQADSLNNQNKVDQAIILVKQAIRIYEQTESWPLQISSINTLARYYDYKSEMETSLDYLKKAETLGLKYLADNSSILANTYQQKGELFIQQNLQDSALYFLAKANQFYTEQQDWQGCAWAQILMVISNYYQMNFKQMDSLLMLVDEMERRYQFAPESEIKETILQWQTILYDETGEYEKAYEVAKKTLDHRYLRLKTNFDSSMLAHNYHNLGAIYRHKGDYDEALRYFHLALDIQKLISGEPLLFYETYRHIGLSLDEKKEHPIALQFYRKGLNYLSQVPKNGQEVAYIDCYVSLGRSFIENNKPDTAVTYLKKALDLSLHKNYAQDLVLVNLGLAYQKKKDNDLALSYLQEALQSNLTAYGKYHPRRIIIYQYLGVLHSMEESPSIALNYFQKAICLLAKECHEENPFDNPNLEAVVDKLRFLELLQLKGTSLLKISTTVPELKKIHASYQLADSLIDHLRRNHESEGAKKILSKQGHAIYETGIKVATMLYDSTRNQDFLTAAFIYAEKSKGLLLLESLKTLQSANQHRSPDFDPLFQEVKRLKLAIVFYQRKLFEEQQQSNLNPSKIKIWEAALSNSRADYERQRFRLEKDFPSFYHLNFTAKTTSPQSIRKYLLQNPNTAFIEYFMGDSTLYTFVISNTDFQVFQLKRTKVLDQMIDALGQQQGLNPSLVSKQEVAVHFENYTSTAYYLFQQILAPALKGQMINQIIIVPDGKLSYLSFDALLTEECDLNKINYSANHLSYVLKKYQTSYAYSGTLLIENLQRSNTKATKNYGGFAPIFENEKTSIAPTRACSDTQLGTLTNSEESVQQALALFGGQTFLHQEATKSKFLNQAATFQLLHLSTHACVDPQDPMFSKIHFHDDYINTYELYNLELHADLVVLSACETGLGPLVNGEGVFSLARGFMQAGCPAVVTSLWNANDYATAQIIIDFHKNIKAKQSKDQALRNAKLIYLKKAPSRLSAPYYWATFIGIGNMEAVDLESPTNLPLSAILLIIMLFSILLLIYKKYFS